ncbi:MAG: peptide-methionine (S)-S-oxide reductase MsrA [Reinekea sp.]|jgi:peptide-methionine (S)-S-oxide reductase|nr:peptide-methionine (S)-S-oxide reductase MsrA [Reinekea sp.]
MSKIKELPTQEQLLPGRDTAMSLNFNHIVFARDMREVPAGCEVVWLGLGCFWGAERLFWQLPGVQNTAVGYAGGATPNPTYEEVCSGFTGHTEIVQVVYDPAQISLTDLLKTFWEAHDPTQGMRQGNDIGTQYRSAIYGSDAQLAVAEQSKQAYQQQLTAKGLGAITTELKPAPTFYFAEEYHQQYLHKNPNGYCGLKGTGVVCPI